MIPRALRCTLCSSRLTSLSLCQSQLPLFHWGKHGCINLKIGERALHSQGSKPPFELNRKTYRPRRALMYVPGSDEKKIKKISTLEADCIVLDCEDGVSITKKVEARKLIRETLDSKEISFGRSERAVRVNSVGSGMCEEDLREILSVKNLPTSILLPKVDSVDDVKWFISKASTFLQGRKKDLAEPINLILMIESGTSMLSLPEITKQAIQVCKKTEFITDGLIFGSDDYCASIGATRTNEATEIIFPRQYVATVARTYQLHAIDIVYIDFKDQTGLIRQAMDGAAMGYTGKQVIHPAQISICHEAFAPSPSKIKWARELIEEFEIHSKSGQGAFVFHECSVDMPIVLQARNIVDLYANLKSSVEKAQKDSEKEKGKDNPE